MARALVFEDNPINSKMLSTFLHQAGYAVDFALKFDELVAMHTDNYDFVMIDVDSPALDVYTLRDFVARSKSYKCPPLIAILNSGSDKAIKEHLNMGMDGYIVRPVGVKSLREMVERITTGHTIPTPGDDMIDLDKMSVELKMPDKNTLIKFFDQFFVSADNEIKQMYSAVNMKDYNALRILSGRFKAASRNIKLSNLAKLAEDIESQTKYPSASTNMNKMVQNLAQACKRVYDEYYIKYKKAQDT